jgi:hypothetical protein
MKKLLLISLLIISGNLLADDNESLKLLAIERLSCEDPYVNTIFKDRCDKGINLSYLNTAHDINMFCEYTFGSISDGQEELTESEYEKYREGINKFNNYLNYFIYKGLANIKRVNPTLTDSEIGEIASEDLSRFVLEINKNYDFGNTQENNKKIRADYCHPSVHAMFRKTELVEIKDEGLMIEGLSKIDKDGLVDGMDLSAWLNQMERLEPAELWRSEILRQGLMSKPSLRLAIMNFCIEYHNSPKCPIADEEESEFNRELWEELMRGSMLTSKTEEERINWVRASYCIIEFSTPRCLED